MMRRGIQTLKSYLRLAGYVRWSRAFMAFILVLSVFIPIFTEINDIKAYGLTTDTKKVLGEANKNLSAKFSFDKEKNRWQFNKNGAAALASDIAKQQGGKDNEGLTEALSQLTAKKIGGSGKNDTSLYSVNLPVRAQDGITYFDNVTHLSFKMIPDFVARDGKLVDGRIVYPFGGGKVVYTAKPDGLKEDIVLSDYISDTLRYGYKLELPDTLQARINDDGSVGIYSANPALFGNISFNNDNDRERVMEGRKNGDKNNLVFSIPAPIIKDQTGAAGHTEYELRNGGKSLTVVASQLKNLHYPLTVDPSVTVTSTADFQAGNMESNVTLGSGQINRGDITGGTFSAWHFTDNSADRGTTQNAGSGAANGMITNRHSFSVTTYNGYMYALGGSNNSGLISPGTVERAPINSNGTLGTWVSSGNLPEARENAVTLAYNGFLYLVGGYTGGGSFSTDVKFAAINSSDGSLGSWTAAPSMTVGRTSHAAVVYNNMMYIINGCTRTSGTCNNGNPVATVYCASIYATGQLSSWNDTCGTTGLTGRDGFTAVAYNGYIYGAGGCATYAAFACTSQPTTIQYSKINSDGTLGSWQTTSTSFTGGRGFVNLVVNNGYLYLTGDSGGNYTNVMQYAAIRASGDVGTWRTGNSYTTARTYAAMATSGNYLYVVGGCSNWSAACGATKNDVQYAQIDLAGVIEPYATETDTIETDGLMHSAAVAYNGWLYMLGGMNGPSMSNSVTTVYKAALNADGSTGAWSTTSSFSAQRGDAAAVAYDGYMYLLGGQHTTADTSCSPSAGLYCTDVQKAVINSDGTLGAWSSAGGDYSTTGRASLGAAAYNGYIYAFGGVYNNNSSVTTETTVGQIQSNGNVTGWTTTGSLVTGVESVEVAQYGKYLFAIAGRTASVNFNNVVQYAILNDSGTITWQSTGAFTNGRADFMAAAYNGYVYIAGGTFGAGSNTYNDTQYARICQTTATVDGCNGTVGTLGTWHTTQSFTTTRGAHTGTIYNGYIYVMGGCSNWGILGACSNSTALLNDLQYAKINNGGNGAAYGWTNTGMTNLPAANRHHGSVAYNGYLYVMGGQDGSNSWQTSVKYSPITDTGNGAWTSTNAYATLNNDQGISFLAYNGYMYKIGGWGGQLSSIRNDVQYAPICTAVSVPVASCTAAGALGTWQYTWSSTSGGSQGGGLATARYAHDAVVYNGRLYVSGGCTSMNSLNACLSITNTVETAAINADGTVGTWSTIGTNLPSTLWNHRMVAYNGYIYAISGCDTVVSNICGSLTARVYYAHANSSGLDSDAGCGAMWCRSANLATARKDFAAYAYNGYLYIIGGQNAAGNPLSDMTYAPVTTGGLLGSWNTAPPAFPTARSAFGAGAVYNGKVYILGGCTNTNDCNGGATADVEQATLTVQSRIGRYSKLITVNPSTDIAGVYYNATLDGGSSVEYRVAPSSGIFGSLTSATQGTGSEPTPLCGQGTIFYVQVVVTLGDVQDSTYADYGVSTLTDITVYYRLNATPPPNLRMNGGKWFYSETQQPLDICKQ